MLGRIDCVATDIDGVHPPITRALEKATPRLNHEVVDWEPSLHRAT